MTVKELIETLKDLPQDLQVVMSKDGEGNNYSPLDSHSVGRYMPDSTWSGDYLSIEDAEEGGFDNAEPVVCLWPVN